jgi:hypothetical protein
MTEHADPATTRQPVLHDGREPMATADVTAENPEQAYAAIEEFAKTGKGRAQDIPTLFSRLGVVHLKRTVDLYSALSPRLSGAVLLEIADKIYYPLHFAVIHAIDAKPTVPEAVLRGYLQSRTVEQLVDLDENPKAIAKLRAIFKGPLGFEIPALGGLDAPIHTKVNLVRWYLDTTTPTVAAIELARSASPALAATVETIGKWGWLDALHIAADPTVASALREYRQVATKPDVQAKLDKLLTHSKTEAEHEQGRPAARTELEGRLKKSGDTPGLIDAAARSGSSPGIAADATKRLSGESADTILEVAHTTRLPLATTLALLADKGAPQHVQMVLHNEALIQRFEALQDDKVRSLARRGLGRAFPLAGLFEGSTDADFVHDLVLEDEALRNWAYEDKDPLTLLWLAAGVTTKHKASCALVGREKGFGWVKQLPRTSPRQRLDRFILNCSDPAAVKHVQDHVLDERKLLVDARTDDPTASDGVVHGVGTQARFEVASLADEIPAHELVSRIADMNAGERSALLADASAVSRIINKLTHDEQLERAIFLLAPTPAQLLALPLGARPELVSYLRTRPPAEEAAALARPELTRKARSMFPRISPFLVFPTLGDPAALAAALENADVLAWMLEGADADLVLTSLARPGVREQAAALLETYDGLYKQLPLYKHLTKQAQASFGQLKDKLDEDDDARADADAFPHDNQPRTDPAAKRGETLAGARRASNLWDALEELRAAGDAASVLAVLRAYPQDHVELLAGSHTITANLVRDKVKLPPQHVFPAIGIDRLLVLEDARKWLLSSERGFHVLSLIAGKHEAIKQLGSFLNSNLDLAFEFIYSLPRGADLSIAETRTIDSLRLSFLDTRLLTGFFEVRFASKLGPTFDVGMEIHKLWNVLARLPPAQVNQEVIKQFVETKDIGKASGAWDGSDVLLKENMESEDSMFNRTPLLTADEVKRYYGLEGAALAQASKKGGWIKQVGDKYQVRPVNHLDQFTNTVLHEVGHSVDTMLGNRTEVVFGVGGWRVYGIDQVESWATDMGGLDRIPEPDRSKIVEAWRRALRTGESIKSMVDADHPALSNAYAHSPLVQAALADETFDYEKTLRESKGRVWITGNNLGYLCSVPKATADVAPSIYAMSAPQEFFAESYVEYYRTYDGTPDTEANKGGKLATWIKDWFTKNVDTLRLNPRRVRKGNDDDVPKAQDSASRGKQG